MSIPIRFRAYAAMVGVAVIWGAAIVIIKSTLSYLPPLTFLFLRFLIMMPIVLPWCYVYMKKHRVKRSDLLPLGALAVMAPTLHLALIFMGINKTSAIDANLIGITAPIFISIWGVLFLKEIITKRELFGLYLAVIGTVITIIQPILAGDAFAVTHLEGNMIILGSTVLWSVFVLITKITSSRFPPLLIMLAGGVVAVPFYGIGSFIESGYALPHIAPLFSEPIALFGLFYTAYISYILGYWLYEYGMSKIEISEAAQFTYLQPLIATPLAVYWLHESVNIPFIIGAVLIFSGVVLSEWK